MPCQRSANLEGQRSQECERGTQECVRHNGFNTLAGATKLVTLRFSVARRQECVRHTRH